MADAAKLKAAVFRATNDAGDGEGDPAAMIEISEKLREHPNLIVEAVKNIKARVKDKSPAVSLLALDLLDQCMQSNGLQFQMQVQKKVLPRILKLALPNKGTHKLINTKCANLIRSWVEYGQDGRLAEYAAASKDLARAEEKAQLQQQAAAQRPGASPPAQDRPGGGGGGGGATRNRDMSPPPPNPGMAQYGMGGGGPPVVDLEQAQENLDLMTSMMEADAVNVRNNEVLAEVALLCKGCQVAILNQIGEVTDEAQLQKFLTLNDKLAEKLEQYESAMVPQANRERRAQEMSAMSGMPMATEGQNTLSDGRAFDASAAREVDVASSPNYNEEDELAKALAESAKMAEQEAAEREVVDRQHEAQTKKQEDLLALNDLFSSPPPPAAPPAAPSLPAAGGGMDLFGGGGGGGNDLLGGGGGGDDLLGGDLLGGGGPSGALMSGGMASMPLGGGGGGGGGGGLLDEVVSDPVEVNVDRENWGESNAAVINEEQRVQRQLELSALAAQRAADPFGGPALASMPAQQALPETVPASNLMDDLFGSPAPPPPPPAATMPAADLLNSSPSADPFSALSAANAATVPSPPKPSGTVSGAAMSVEGSTPGATSQQMAAWHARLAVNKEGVLYEDSFMQIGVKTDYQGTQGKVNLFLGNKKQEAITDLKLEVDFTPEVSGMCGNPGSVIEPRQQMQISVSVECRAAFSGSLPLSIAFAVGFERRTIRMRLPVVVAKFLAPVTLQDAAFAAKWESSAHQGSAVTVQSNEKWCNEQTLKALMTNGLHMGVVEGRASGALAAAATLAGVGGGEVLVELSLADAAARRFSLAVRASDPTLRDGMEDLVSVILQSTRK